MQNNNYKYILYCLCFIFFISDVLFPQSQIVNTSDPVYSFLKRMQLKGIIEYNSSILPMSREKIAGYIKEIDSSKKLISRTDSKYLLDFKKEFEYELTGKTVYSSGFVNKPSIESFVSDKKKYFYKFNDSIATLFINIQGYLSPGFSSGDSLLKNGLLLGNLGFKVNGTLFNHLGFSLKASNGQKVAGDNKSLDFVTETRPYFRSYPKFKSENNNFDYYEGYLRYKLGKDVFAVTIGRDAVNYGFGYIDKLFLSNNSVPFNFIKFDINYGAFSYNFLYGSLKGDSLGKRDIEMKNIVTHRLSVNFSKSVRAGFFEALITSDRPFNFTFINPFSIIRSADYNAGSAQSGLNNALMGFDIEVNPARNFAVQGSLLIDDLNFSTIFTNKRESGTPANDNRFGWQLGSIWTDAFYLPNLTFAVEYTRLNPFVYTHKTNKSQYTNWGLPLGHNLTPNSDEIAVKMDYIISNRISLQFIYQHQRSGNGIIISGDTLIRNYGGDINRGDGDAKYDNTFLEGNRVNRNILTFNIKWQPVYQYFINLKYVYRNIHNIFENKKLNDNYLWAVFSVEF